MRFLAFACRMCLGRSLLTQLISSLTCATGWKKSPCSGKIVILKAMLLILWSVIVSRTMPFVDLCIHVVLVKRVWKPSFIVHTDTSDVCVLFGLHAAYSMAQSVIPCRSSWVMYPYDTVSHLLGFAWCEVCFTARVTRDVNLVLIGGFLPIPSWARKFACVVGVFLIMYDYSFYPALVYFSHRRMSKIAWDCQGFVGCSPYESQMGKVLNPWACHVPGKKRNYDDMIKM